MAMSNDVFHPLVNSCATDSQPTSPPQRNVILDPGPRQAASESVKVALSAASRKTTGMMG